MAWFTGVVLVVMTPWSVHRYQYARALREVGPFIEGATKVVDLGCGLSPLFGSAQGVVASKQAPSVARAWQSADEAGVLRALGELGADTLCVPWHMDTLQAGLVDRSRREGLVTELHAKYVSAAYVVYAPRHVPRWKPEDAREAQSRAHAILFDNEDVPVAAFPQALRQHGSFEVMLALRDGDAWRMWRSVRASTIAQAVRTAAQVAHKRWGERERSLGGALHAQRARLRVELYLLEHEGVLGNREPAFLQRAVLKGLGVGFERKGAWHYLLPAAVQRDAAGNVERAYGLLFQQAGMDASSLGRKDVRLYRFQLRSIE